MARVPRVRTWLNIVVDGRPSRIPGPLHLPGTARSSALLRPDLTCVSGKAYRACLTSFKHDINPRPQLDVMSDVASGDAARILVHPRLVLRKNPVCHRRRLWHQRRTVHHNHCIWGELKCHYCRCSPLAMHLARGGDPSHYERYSQGLFLQAVDVISRGVYSFWFCIF
jgi:hypothetical protein